MNAVVKGYRLINMIHTNRSNRLRTVFRDQAVLVTGGLGFIGSHLTAELVRRGARVTVLDLSTDPERESLLNLEGRRLREQTRVVEGDIADAAFVRSLVSHGGFRYVFNLAAGATVIERAVADPFKTVESNTTALVNLLEAVRQAPEPPQVVFQASTDKVYGDANGEPYDEDRTPLQSVGLYDCSKLAADILARAWFSVFSVPTIVLRLCNIIGPWDFNAGYRLVPKAMQSLFGSATPQPPELYFEALEHQRDYLFIGDCVRAILLLAACPPARGQVFNLPGCSHLSTPAMCKAIIEAAVQVEERFDPARAEIMRKNGVTLKMTGPKPQVITIKVQHSSGEKLRRLTGFVPKTTLPEALVRTAQAFRDYYRLGDAHVGPYRLVSADQAPRHIDPSPRLVG
jgi:nucleoside-diphosphate-sugar epimerase